VESKTTPETLYQAVTEMLDNGELRRGMGEAAKKLAGEDAARRVAEEIEASCDRN
jgi:UDP-N-acetylglucosamine:LPS N-acetylglucosamine transferase